MLREEDIALELRCQQFLCKSYMRDLDEYHPKVIMSQISQSDSVPI